VISLDVLKLKKLQSMVRVISKKLKMICLIIF
jgi:hypothetical protein